MAKFSLGRDDGQEGPSNSRPKRQKRNSSGLEQTPQEQVPEPELESAEEEVASDYEEDEGGEGEEQEEGESGAPEEDWEEEESDGGHNEAQRGNPEQISDGGDGSISVTLTDPEVLDCPVCLEHLTVPVYQCENGHVACSCCCGKLKNRCPSCLLPIGYSRCRAIEKVIESVSISCSNMKYGCKERMSYAKKHEHEESCKYAPCSCPHTGCDFIGCAKNLYAHFSAKHYTASERFMYNSEILITLTRFQRRFILQDASEGRLFILYKTTEVLGDKMFLSCIGPTPWKKGFAYDLLACNGGYCSVSLRSFTEMALGPDPDPRLKKKFLLAPEEFRDASGLLNLKLYIWKN